MKEISASVRDLVICLHTLYTYTCGTIRLQHTNANGTQEKQTEKLFLIYSHVCLLFEKHQHAQLTAV